MLSFMKNTLGLFLELVIQSHFTKDRMWRGA